jgi:hypothetical protein
MRVGHADTRQLGEFMRKPQGAVVAMSFSADPNEDLRTDAFSGPAVVFLATVNTPIRTAALAR